MKPEILFRLTLAKALYNAAISACSTDVDNNKFALGLIGLHDAVDNFLGASVNQFNLNKGKGYLKDSLDAIEGHLKSVNKALICKSEILKLNTLRNDIKHQGITPDIQTNKTLVKSVEAFLIKCTKEFFSLDWNTISLSDLIKKNEIREMVKDIELLIENEKYKEAMYKMAIVKFDVFDRNLLEIQCNPKWDLGGPSKSRVEFRKQSPIFPSRDYLNDFDHRLNLIEMSIDPRSFRILEEYTAKVGFDNASKRNVVLEYNHNWCPPNWTSENAVYCYNLLVDLILKNQDNNSLFRRQKNFRTEYEVRILNAIQIFDKNGESIGKVEVSEKIYNAIIFDYIDGCWQNFKADFWISLYDETGEIIGGYATDQDKDKIEFLKSNYVEIK